MDPMSLIFPPLALLGYGLHKSFLFIYNNKVIWLVSKQPSTSGVQGAYGNLQKVWFLFLPIIFLSYTGRAQLIWRRLIRSST